MAKAFAFLFLLGICNFATKGNEIDAIGTKYRTWILGSKNLPYEDPLIQERYKSILSQAKTAHTKYDELDQESIRETPFYFNSNKSGVLRTLVCVLLFPLCVAYHIEGSPQIKNPDYKNPKTLKKITDIFDILHEKGWKRGLHLNFDLKSYENTGVIGLGGSVALDYLGYGISIFLMQEEIKQAGIFEREMDTLDWVTHYIGPTYNYPVIWKESGFNADVVRSLMNTKLCYILTMKADNPERQEEMRFFARLLNKSLEIANGFSDTIKPDFTGYHHKGMYANAYSVNSFHTASLYAHLLNKTSYAIDSQSTENLSRALLANRLYAHPYDIPRAIGGRFPYKLNTLQENLPAYAYMSGLSHNPLSSTLKSAFMRLWNPQDDEFHKDFIKATKCRISYFGSLGALEETLKLAKQNVAPEATPQGYWFFPYGGLTIYRQGEHMVSWHGTSQYIWDFEGPTQKSENQYGRYSGAGGLQIYSSNETNSAIESGYGIDGWNWSRIPGATTLDMPAEALPTKKARNFSTENFLGGVSLGEKTALSSFAFADMTSSLKAFKSLFFFDRYIYALGNGISAKEPYDVQTTLFQREIKDEEQVSFLNGKKLKKEKLNSRLSNDEAATYVDSRKNVYYLPKSVPASLERGLQTNPIADKNNQLKTGWYETARLLHGINPVNASYRYVIQIDGGNEGAKKLATEHDSLFEVILANEESHIVHYKPAKVTGYALKNPESFPGDALVKRVDRPCLFMVHQEGQTCKIALSNPDLARQEKSLTYKETNSLSAFHAKSKKSPVKLTLKGAWALQNNAEEIKIISSDKQSTTLEFPCQEGRTFQVSLIRNKN